MRCDVHGGCLLEKFCDNVDNECTDGMLCFISFSMRPSKFAASLREIQMKRAEFCAASCVLNFARPYVGHSREIYLNFQKIVRPRRAIQKSPQKNTESVQLHSTLYLERDEGGMQSFATGNACLRIGHHSHRALYSTDECECKRR